MAVLAPNAMLLLVAFSLFIMFERTEEMNMHSKVMTILQPNVIVAQDGSGNFSSIQATIDAAPPDNALRHTIYIKRGSYKEYVCVPRNKPNIFLFGDGIDQTIITRSRFATHTISTSNTCTVCVDGGGFMAWDLTIENTVGPQKGQAVALRINADKTIVYRSKLSGYQDTLYEQDKRQFYPDCIIYGTIDFIFGDATAIFQNCFIRSIRPLIGQAIMITAEGRVDIIRNIEIVFQNCTVTPAADLIPVSNKFQVLLGRPWKKYVVTVVIESWLDSFIQPAGWAIWDQSTNHKTAFYGEFANGGSGYNTKTRAKWSHPNISMQDTLPMNL